jgi:hypothetical protein
MKGQIPAPTATSGELDYIGENAVRRALPLRTIANRRSIAKCFRLPRSIHSRKADRLPPFMTSLKIIIGIKTNWPRS